MTYSVQYTTVNLRYPYYSRRKLVGSYKRKLEKNANGTNKANTDQTKQSQQKFDTIFNFPRYCLSLFHFSRIYSYLGSDN